MSSITIQFYADENLAGDNGGSVEEQDSPVHVYLMPNDGIVIDTSNGIKVTATSGGKVFWVISHT